VKPAAVKSVPSTPQQQLARATRATLAAHTALFRVRWSINYVTPPAKNEDINPYETVAGVVDFDNNRWVQHVVVADHAAQPTFPSATGVSDGDNVFTGNTTKLVNDGVWNKGTLSACNNADSLADVLSFTTGKIAVKKYQRLYQETGYTQYTAKVDFGRQLQDSCSAADRSVGRSLAGQLMTENVWVNRDGQISMVQFMLDPGSMKVPGISASEVKAIYRTVELGSFGVKLVIPPHRTS
jgi:hypothetical protein